MTTENFKILFVQAKFRTNKKNQSALFCRLTLNGNRKQLSTGIYFYKSQHLQFLLTSLSQLTFVTTHFQQEIVILRYVCFSRLQQFLCFL